jgi:hypothetical protein
VGIWNPPYERLAETCAAQSAAFLRVAALLPSLSVELLGPEKVGEHTRSEIRIVNQGYLASHGLPSAKTLPHCEPLRLTARAEGLSLLAPTEAVIDLGQLEGWGGGLYGGPSVFSPWTRGNAHERFVTLITTGSGSVQVEVGSCRVGFQRLEVPVA